MGKKYVLKNILFALLSNGITLTTSALTLLLIPRILSVSSYGYFQLYTFYAGYLGLFNIGWLEGIYLKIGGAYYDDLNKENLNAQYKRFNLFITSISILLMISSVLLISDVDRKYIFLLVALCIIPYARRNYWDNILLCCGRMREYTRSCFLDRFSYLGLIILLLLLRCENVLFFVLADVFGKSMGWLSSKIACSDIQRTKTSGVKVRTDILDNIKCGINLLIANLSSMLVIGSFRMNFEHSWDIEIYSQMSLTLNISNMLLTFINAVSQVFYSLLRRITEEKQHEIYIVLRTVVACFTLGICLFYVPLKEILVLILPKYEFGLKYMAILLPMCFIECKWALLTQTYLKALREERKILLVNVLAVLVSLILAGLSVTLMKNLLLAVVCIIIVLSFRGTLGEILLCRKLHLNLLEQYIKEAILICVFILLNWNLGDIRSAILFALAYIIYIISESKNVKMVLSNIKSIRR